MDGDSDFSEPIERKEQEQTLVCFEYCGLWELSVDVTVKEPKKWFINIEGSFLSLPLELSSVHSIQAAVDFLELNIDQDSESTQERLQIGRFQGLPVHLESDDEYPDRCFIVIGRIDGSAVRFKLAGEDHEHFLHALKNVLKNLEHDGLL